MENGYTLSDYAAVTNGNGFGGGNSFIYLIALLALFNGGFGGWNNRGGDYGAYATAASQQDILFGQKFSDLDNKIDRLSNGLADLGYALNNSIKDGNAMVAGRVVDEGRALQMQLAEYNCSVQKNIDSVRFEMANYANAINSNMDNKYAQLEKNQMQAQIDALKQENQQIFLQQQMCGVVRYPNAWTWDAGPSPFCNYNSCGNCCAR